MRLAIVVLLAVLVTPIAATAEDYTLSPPELLAFEKAFEAGAVKQLTETNGIRRNELVHLRGVDLRLALGDWNSFTDWHLQVVKVAVGPNGMAWVSLAVPKAMRGADASFSLINSPPTPGDAEVRLAPGSPLYNTVKDFETGDEVMASGTFFRDGVSGYVEGHAKLGHTLELQMMHPLFVVRYTSLKKI
jgi:hypothetical protein